MSEQNQDAANNQEKHWREYELCHKAAQNLESLIWQTSGVMGVGSIGTLVLVANRVKSEQPPWYVALVIGFVLFFGSIIWWFMARRWWSIQQALFIRMRHIEESLGIYALRYLHYLDCPAALSESGLPPKRAEQLRNRAKQRGLFAPHQRAGVQRALLFLPFLILLAWGLYTLFLALQ